MHSDASSSSVVRLDIGGKKFSTAVDTLTQREPHSMLAAMFGGRHTVCKDSKGYVFIDRDGKHFRHVLNWLRDGVVPDLTESECSELLREAKYYQLLGLVDGITEVLNRKKAGKEKHTRLTRNDVIKRLKNEKARSSGGVNLSDLDLSNLDLSYVDFSYARLKNILFSGANLECAKFRDVDAENNDFHKATLRKCEFTGANLRGALLDGANLHSANLKYACLMDCSFRGADLRSAQLQSANLTNANLEGANLEGACINDAKVHNANFKGANLKLQYARRVNFHSTHLDGENKALYQLEGVDLEDYSF